MKKKILLIGWDAADWNIINPLLDAGKMPNLSKLVSNGVIGNNATLQPVLSPMLWTSIATGKRPYKHGIYGFIEPDPSGEYVRPISNISRKSKALWNICTQSGLKSIVVGWWPSHPAEPINGVMVSNHYQKAVAPLNKPWHMQPMTVHPARLNQNMAVLRFHPQMIEPSLIHNFLPNLANIDQEKDKRVESVAKIIAENITINRAAIAIMHHEPWDFTAVYFDGIDHFGHGFMNYAPPKQDFISNQDYENYKNVVEAGYLLHDAMLGAMLNEIDENTTVIITSDHGFKSEGLRPRHIPMQAAGPAVQHRNYGVFVAMGPGIKKDERIYGMNLLDICPTILHILGLPIGEDMDGRVLVNLFEKKPEIKTIPSWEEVEGFDGSHDDNKKMDTLQNSEAMQQLIELGYIEKPDENKQKAILDCNKELHYNLAVSYIDGGLNEEAKEILEALWNDWPNDFRFSVKLFYVYRTLGDIDKAHAIYKEMLERKKKVSENAKEEFVKLREKYKDKNFADLDRSEQQKFKKLQSEVLVNNSALAHFEATILMDNNEFAKAEEILTKFLESNHNQPIILQDLSDCYIKFEKYKSAEEILLKLYEYESADNNTLLKLSEIYLKLKNSHKATDFALKAIALRYHNPKAHYLLGVALQRRHLLYEASQAFRLAIAQNPNYLAAYKRLIQIAKNRLNDQKLVDEYKEKLIDAKKRITEFKTNKKFPNKQISNTTSLTSDKVGIKQFQSRIPKNLPNLNDTVFIVSGLPRSGTSLMMQMLDSADCPIFSDGKRKPDEYNPKGYYEYEKVKSLKKDNKWIPNVKGNAIKIISHLLPYIPANKNFNYRILFMNRPLDEILSSQNSMAGGLTGKQKLLPPNMLKETFMRQVSQIQLLLENRRIPVLYVNYHDILNKPDIVIEEMKTFLPSSFNFERMKTVIDLNLYRHKA